jgi:hypothetical protein
VLCTGEYILTYRQDPEKERGVNLFGITTGVSPLLCQSYRREARRLKQGAVKGLSTDTGHEVLQYGEGQS